MNIVYFLCLFFIPSFLWSASIKKIVKNKSTVLVDPEGDKNFKKNAKVCFKNDEVNVGCGKITSIKKNIAYITVDKDSIEKIKNNSEVSLNQNFVSGHQKKPFFIVRGLWTGPMIYQVSFNEISYIPQDENELSGKKFWNIESQASALIFSVGGEIEVPRIKTTLGFRYRKFSLQPKTTNYSISSEEASPSTVTPEAQASSVGFYTDFYFLSLFDIKFGSGIDFDQSTIHYLFNKNDSTTGEIVSFAELYSTIREYSFRIPIRYEKHFSAFGFFAGATALLPMSGTPVFSSEVNDPQDFNQESNQQLQIALDHKKASFALDVVVGVQMGL